MLCRLMLVNRSSYYFYRNRPIRLISVEELALYRSAKELFRASRSSLGSRGLSKALCKIGHAVGRYKSRFLMKKLSLIAIQRRRFCITTVKNKTNAIADNLLNQDFNPLQKNQSWVADITYLPTDEGWLYLAVIMDLYARKIVGWAMDNRLKQELSLNALTMAINLRQPVKGLIHHSDQGVQYTAKAYRALLETHDMQSSMSGKGCCYDNAVVERFFGSLKYEWLANKQYDSRLSMKTDVLKYIDYYNGTRLHSYLGYNTPIDFENSLLEVS